MNVVGLNSLVIGTIECEKDVYVAGRFEGTIVTKGALHIYPEGEVKAPWGSYDIVRDLGVVALGPNLVSLDAVLCGLINVDPEKVSYLQKGEEAFGEYDRRLVNEAKAVASEWFLV